MVDMQIRKHHIAMYDMSCSAQFGTGILLFVLSCGSSPKPVEWCYPYLRRRSETQRRIISQDRATPARRQLELSLGFVRPSTRPPETQLFPYDLNFSRNQLGPVVYTS